MAFFKGEEKRKMENFGWGKDMALIGSFGCELSSVNEWSHGPSAGALIGQNAKAQRNFHQSHESPVNLVNRCGQRS